MKTTSYQQIFDNCFKWQYVGKCMLIFIATILTLSVLIIFFRFVFPALFSLMSHQEIVQSKTTDNITFWFVVIIAVLIFVRYVFYDLPQMCTGTYRVDSEHLLVKEKMLGYTTADMYIPLSALTNVSYKKDIWRWLSFPYKEIEIEVNGITYVLHCLAHQDELFEHLQKAVEQNRNNN